MCFVDLEKVMTWHLLLEALPHYGVSRSVFLFSNVCIDSWIFILGVNLKMFKVGLVSNPSCGFHGPDIKIQPMFERCPIWGLEVTSLLFADVSWAFSGMPFKYGAKEHTASYILAPRQHFCSVLVFQSYLQHSYFWFPQCPSVTSRIRRASVCKVFHSMSDTKNSISRHPLQVLVLSDQGNRESKCHAKCSKGVWWRIECDKRLKVGGRWSVFALAWIYFMAAPLTFLLKGGRSKLASVIWWICLAKHSSLLPFLSIYPLSILLIRQGHREDEGSPN